MLEAVEALTLLTELLAAIAPANTPKTLVRALGESLGTRLPIRRVELRAMTPTMIAEHADDGWHVIDSPPAQKAMMLADGLAVMPTRALPEWCAGAEFRAALGQVIAAAVRHVAVIERVATRSRRAHHESRELRADLVRFDPATEVIARSTAMRAAVARAQLVAPHPTTVLLTGESGSGKEVLAREIHRRSPRSRHPLLQLDCGALPEQLVESELFGHERGAFTGAEQTHLGMFERAHRGTLFLDEVGELPLAAQAKLLRALQERQIRRVGGVAQIAVDVRVIAATNRPLADMVNDGRFREDLYYRLDVFAIRVPALRERRGDLAPLVHALVSRLAARLEQTPPTVTRTLLAKLEAHDWPGNVRELANVLETALILGNGRTLELPPALARRPPLRKLAPRFDRAIRDAIEDALRATRGKIYGSDGAAARLGLKPATLQSKMLKLAIRRDDFQ